MVTRYETVPSTIDEESELTDHIQRKNTKKQISVKKKPFRNFFFSKKTIPPVPPRKLSLQQLCLQGAIPLSPLPSIPLLYI